MSLSRNCPVSSFPIVALFGGGTFDGLDRTCHSLAGFSHHELQLHGSQTPAAPHSINFDPIVVDMVIMVQDNPIYLPRCFCQCLFGFPFTLRQSLHEAFRRWQTRSRRVMVVCSLRYQHTQGGLSFAYFDMAATLVQEMALSSPTVYRGSCVHNGWPSQCLYANLYMKRSDAISLPVFCCHTSCVLLNFQSLA